LVEVLFVFVDFADRWSFVVVEEPLLVDTVLE
jgi:hypothetical protein